jgi:hypothetical protein
MMIQISRLMTRVIGKFCLQKKKTIENMGPLSVTRYYQA